MRAISRRCAAVWRLGYFRVRLTSEERRHIMDALAHVGLRVADPVSPPSVVRDPKDDYLVALAAIGDAALIVTGDRDLLDHEGLDPPAVNARDACIRLGLIQSKLGPLFRPTARRDFHGLEREARAREREARARDREARARHQRTRLDGAMIESVHKDGYTGTTVAHIIALAGVSRHAFYTHFANKEECFLATYDISVARSKKRMLDAWKAESGWINRLDRACRAFAEDAYRNSKSMHLVLIEGMGIGPRARERMLLASGAYERVVSTAFNVAPDGVKLPPLAPRAIVGGGRYVTAVRLRQGRESELPELADELLDWVSAYRSPVARRLTARQLPGPERVSVASARFLSGDDSRSRALGAVVHLTLDKGFDKLSDPQIAQLAGLSTESFHNQFPDKGNASSPSLTSSLTKSSEP